MAKPRAEEGPYETPQITLRGRNAWVVQRLAGVRERGIPEAVAWIIDQWINGEGRKQLVETYEIDTREWNRRSNVVSMPEKKRKGDS